ncbi:MAG: AraC family transcriptional regulator [Bacteroidetes bacterium]|nr:MAG: AraC family transcriptional regulator [Bacteroidota bacterium]
MNISLVLYRKIVAGKIYMDQNLHDPINLQHISRNACISRFHFHRLFTRVYKRTPHQYLTKKRIRLACELLSEEKLSVTEICNSVGFASMGSFSTLFKKEMGIGPSMYRHHAITRRQEEIKKPTSFIPHCFIDGFTQI